MSERTKVCEGIIRATKLFASKIDQVKVQDAKVCITYNPLIYAWDPHETYLSTFCNEYKNTIYVGMNPGYFGMVQTGVPFGDVGMVKNFLKLNQFTVQTPSTEHIRRPILGYQSPKPEVSGKRFWALIQSKFGSAQKFFNEKKQFVMNLCPLAFLAESGRNVTPGELSLQERDKIIQPCLEYLREIVDLLQVKNIVCISRFVEQQIKKAYKGNKDLKVVYMVHPSPRVQLNGKTWEEIATSQMQGAQIWEKEDEPYDDSLNSSQDSSDTFQLQIVKDN